MIERLGRVIVINGDVLPVEDYYDGIDDTDDGPVIDRIISGIHAAQTPPVGDLRSLARDALSLLGDDQSPESLQYSIMQHPSAQNIPAERLGRVARDIIQAYQDERARVEQHVRTADLTADRRGLFIAVIRNMEQLDDYDLEQIALTMGYDKDHFKQK